MAGFWGFAGLGGDSSVLWESLWSSVGNILDAEIFGGCLFIFYSSFIEQGRSH